LCVVWGYSTLSIQMLKRDRAFVGIQYSLMRGILLFLLQSPFEDDINSCVDAFHMQERGDSLMLIDVVSTSTWDITADNYHRMTFSLYYQLLIYCEEHTK
jgi:hypothetical protein